MNLVSREERDKEIVKFPKKFFDLCSGRLQHEFLEFRCDTELRNTYGNQPEGGNITSDEDTFPNAKIIPLWECGTTIVAYRMSDKKEFVAISMENPFSPHVISEFIQGVLADLLLNVIEDLGGVESLNKKTTDQEKLDSLAESLEFQYLPELLALQERICEDFSNYDQLVSKFIESLTDSGQS